jgi:Fe-S cluster assembly ATP-binding protein
MTEALAIKNLHASVENKEILRGISLTLRPGEIHAIMGPNGSGKSTLAYALMGHPRYEVKGTITLDGADLAALSADERAKRGLFLSFQYPLEIPGVTVESFLRMAYNSVKGKSISVIDFHIMLKKKMEEFKIDPAFARRSLNEGFSGGERKRMEILQMSILEPEYIILDETDSGLDVDALKIVAQGIANMRGPKHGILLITHFNRILQYVEPDHVHVLVDGKIAKTGGKELASSVEARGYEEHKIKEA